MKKKRKITKIIADIEKDLKDVMEAVDIIEVRTPLIFGKVEKLKELNEKKRKDDN